VFRLFKCRKKVRKERQSTERRAVLQSQLLLCDRWRGFSSNKQQMEEEEIRGEVTAGTEHCGCTTNSLNSVKLKVKQSAP
jgi:hypothetical protein